MIGQTISHYKILEKLGEGGMGVVYKAQDAKLDRLVALKFISPQSLKSEEEKARFIQEAKAAAAINHTNITTIYEINEYENDTFISMEYLEGESLREKINSESIAIEEALKIAAQISEGLQEAHVKGIIHRDIKSANIMITKKGQVKIMDFGLAKLKGQTKLTKNGTTLGTAAYMSPEQSQGKKVDHRTDIWSLGVVLYEMVTGQLPFKGDYEQAVVYSILNEDPEPVSGLRSGIPLQLEIIINKVLSKNLSERYQNLEECIIDINKVKKNLFSGEKYPIRKRKTRLSFKNLLAAIIAFMIVITVSYLILMKESKMPESNSQETIKKPSISQMIWRNSIAVLPFTDLSPNKDQEYFCDGMTEQIITNLTQIPDLKVIARTSVMLYRNTAKDIRQISRELGVKYVMEGSVRKSGKKLRVTAQLINAENGFHIWAKDYNQPLEDVFEVQDNVSQALALALETTVNRDSSKQLADRPKGGHKSQNSPFSTRIPKNIEAYEWFLKGTYHIKHVYLKTHDESDFQKAVKMVQKAIQIDPGFALGYTGLQYIHENHWIITGDQEDLKIEKRYALQALKIDPALPEANSTLALQFLREGDSEKSFYYLKKALQLNPKNPGSLHIMGIFYNAIGLFNQAEAYYLKALDLNPLNVLILNNLGWNSAFLGKFAKAQKYFEKALQIQPDLVVVLNGYAFSLMMTKDYQKAQKLLTHSQKYLSNVTWNFHPVQALNFAYLGEKEKAMKLSSWAGVYIALGNYPKALQEIEKTNTNMGTLSKTFCAYLSLLNLPIFDPLREDRRFQSLLKIEKKKYLLKLEKYKIKSEI